MLQNDNAYKKKKITAYRLRSRREYASHRFERVVRGRRLAGIIIIHDTVISYEPLT